MFGLLSTPIDLAGSFQSSDLPQFLANFLAKSDDLLAACNLLTPTPTLRKLGFKKLQNKSPILIFQGDDKGEGLMTSSI
ncbi:hypothetical protein CEXT_549781 [Caerostris extrusa]|uniref:Uncharacterized protein n=1 Tax=Caerostris extrusa TaxID=172846 RepID=A0AAV4QVI6_CAEEX|nr:hypothetical protein CEXT_549781 [Caerostris extrusa]